MDRTYISCLEPFLETGAAFASLSLLGKMPQRKESLIRAEISGEI